MAEINVIEFSTMPAYAVEATGSAATGDNSNVARKRVRMYIRGTVATAADTLNCAAYVPGLTGIDMVETANYLDSHGGTSSVKYEPGSASLTFDTAGTVNVVATGYI